MAKHIPKITNFVAYDYYRDNMRPALAALLVVAFVRSVLVVIRLGFLLHSGDDLTRSTSLKILCH